MTKREGNKVPIEASAEPLAGADIERFAEILKALANPTRLRIVNILVRGERTVSGLCELSGLKQSLVSQQLKILRLSNIVQSRKEVPHTYYRLKERNVIRMLDCLSRCGTRETETTRKT